MSILNKYCDIKVSLSDELVGLGFKKTPPNQFSYRDSNWCIDGLVIQNPWTEDDVFIFDLEYYGDLYRNVKVSSIQQLQSRIDYAIRYYRSQQ